MRVIVQRQSKLLWPGFLCILVVGTWSAAESPFAGVLVSMVLTLFWDAVSGEKSYDTDDIEGQERY